MEYFSHASPFWDFDEMNQQEKEKEEEFIKSRIDALKSYYPKEEVAKYVDFPAKKFDLVLDWNKRNGIALVADIIRGSDREMLREDFTNEDEEEDLDESRVIASLNINPWYEICHPRLVFFKRTYQLDELFKGTSKDAFDELKKELAKHTHRKSIEKLGVREICLLLDQVDQERLEKFESRKFKPEEFGFTQTIEQMNEELRRRYERDLELFNRILDEERKTLEDCREWLSPSQMGMTDPLEYGLDLDQQYCSPPEPQKVRFNYLVEYDPKRKIALVANCGLAKHRGCWNELIFTNVALIGKAWYNFLPPKYANKSIDEGIRWMCWMEKGDYFVKEV
jgi:hypothetical protein